VTDDVKPQEVLLELPDVKLMLLGVHEALNPVDGLTDCDIVRVPLKPLRLVAVIVELPVEPERNVTLVGFAATE
jgi:hypothetical protein